MEIAAPVPKGMEAKQTIRILFGKSGNKVVSSKMKFLGDNWFIVAYKYSDLYKFIIKIFRDGLLETLPCSVNYEVKLMGTYGDCISRRGNMGEKDGRHGVTVEHSLKIFDYLIFQNFFDDHDYMTIELDLSVKEQAEDLCAKHYGLFSKSSLFSPDRSILVGGNLIYVNKEFLSIQSAFFKVMFEKDFMEKEQNEIELDVDFNEFIELLSIVYPTGEFISVSNVECLLKLADFYQMPGVLRQCEQFLMLETNIDNLKKLFLAERYRLIDLQEHCASQFQRFNDIKKLEEGEDFARLNERTKAIMLESLVRSNSKLDY